MGITPDNIVFIVLSFEGPDVYSWAGGLGSRITHLTNTLAEMGFQKKSGARPVLLARVGVGSYGTKIAQQPRLAGMVVKDVFLDENPDECYRRVLLEEDFTPYFEAISKGGSGDIVNLLFPIPYSFLQVIYKASDVVLANSIHEPFGLVGLEAMATGAVVFTGCSGEDYATHMYNAIVLDTFSAEEITFYIDYLRMHPERREAISSAARRTAEQWTWEEVAQTLICKLEYQAQVQGAVMPSGATASESARGQCIQKLLFVNI